MLPTLVLPILIASTNAPQATLPERRQSLTGDIRHHRDFESKILGNKRNLIVYLPPDYAKQTRRYPVVYLHDGQNVFDGLTSYIPNQEWRADEAAEALIRAELIEPLILVGIDNAGIARGDEYLPTRTKFGDNEAGGKDRIRPIAARVGAETFEIHPWPGFWGGMWENFKWLLRHVMAGDEIIDAGIDLGRTDRSWFYRMERAIATMFESR